jgi:hypothetical protein
VVIGHEVRSFSPCNGNAALWIMGHSPALADIIAAYRRGASGMKPYTPVVMTLIGVITAPPADGFGAAYDAAFIAEELMDAGFSSELCIEK